MLSWRNTEERCHGAWVEQRAAFYLVGVEGTEDGLDVDGLLHRAARDAKHPLELVEVQSAARTLLHEEEAQLLNLSRVQLLGAALVLSHGPAVEVLLLTTHGALCPPQSEAK